MKKKNRLKITGGKYRGRILKIIDHYKIKPTKSFIREVLFNYLYIKIKNAKCLDCFSGSGILGIESLSRNASYVTFIDSEKKILEQIKKNTNLLFIKNCELIHDNTLKWVYYCKKKYDVVFLDPPFYKNIINKIIHLLEKKNILNNNAYIYIEQEKKNIDVPSNWFLHKFKKSGLVYFFVYIRKKTKSL
ncbi:16S rRNA (guanine(966)-N(2))-methyltransferase RsmD [Buchnera aphidicola (Taiwanaphis decaspermi)]|uniref:16S rRNA (guanine(966)-N(2))-methyltransferase RsmD n=1 Tax=Buchnera aphidicola TaxID=9 RepID=UPI0031B8A3B9